MSLIVEDGTGKTTADSYCSVNFADRYHDDRGNTDWADLGDDEKEQYLRRATDFMAGYRGRWAGYRKTTAQALDWPRFNVPIKDYLQGGDAWYGYSGAAYYADNAVPAQVQQACAELALKVAQGTDLAPDEDTSVTRESIGPIEVMYEPGRARAQRFPRIEQLLSPFFGSSSTTMKVSRS